MHHQQKLPLIKNNQQNHKNDSFDLGTARIYEKPQHYSQERNNQIELNNLATSERTQSYSRNHTKTDRNTVVIFDQVLQNLRQKTEDSTHKFKLQVSDVDQNYKHQLKLKPFDNLDTKNKNEKSNQQSNEKQILKTTDDRIQSDSGPITRKLSLQTDQNISTNRRQLKGFRQIIGNNNKLLTHFHFEHKWLKKLKSIFQTVRAVIRIILLVRPKKIIYDQNKLLELGCKIELQYNKTVNAIRTKQWCQMVFTKAFSIIQSQTIDSQDLNFIENKLSPLDLDNAINVTFQVFWYFLTQFETFTSQKLFLRELGLLMFKDQFELQRKTFNKFVSSRTLYLSDSNRQITDDQKIMIYSESIIINLLKDLMILCNNEKIINLKKPNTIYLIRMIITLLQYLFMITFKDLPKINQENRQLKFIQFQFTQVNKQGLALQESIQSEKDELITGTYRVEQLNYILKKTYWLNSMKKCFKKILNNLFVYKF